jgi:hypothetical protein
MRSKLQIDEIVRTAGALWTTARQLMAAEQFDVRAAQQLLPQLQLWIHKTKSADLAKTRKELSKAATELSKRIATSDNVKSPSRDG